MPPFDARAPRKNAHGKLKKPDDIVAQETGASILGADAQLGRRQRGGLVNRIISVELGDVAAVELP